MTLKKYVPFATSEKIGERQAAARPPPGFV